jgi:hypothetical protein
MRTLIAIICLITIPTGVFAIEPVNEQQIMVYYHIPLGADRQGENKHQFGLRFDQTTHDPGEVTHINTLEDRPAAMDFRMGYQGMQSFKIHGVDYSNLIARAAEGEEMPVEETDIQAAPTEPATQEDQSEPAVAIEDQPEEKTEVEKSAIQTRLDELPFGVIMGVILGIGILAGVGG